METELVCICVSVPFHLIWDLILRDLNFLLEFPWSTIIY